MRTVLAMSVAVALVAGTLPQLLQGGCQESSDLIIPSPERIPSAALAELGSALVQAGLRLVGAPRTSTGCIDRLRGGYHVRTFGLWRDFGTAFPTKDPHGSEVATRRPGKPPRS